jgi:hypothetical protein
MSLRVTDVQAALRHFANIGHDVLTDSRAVHVDGKPYRMPVGHSLLLQTQGGNPFNSLSSYISQSERPLISHVQTLSVHHPDSMNELRRFVDPLNAHVLKTTLNDKAISRYLSGNANTTGWFGVHGESSHLPNGITPIWTPRSYKQNAADMPDHANIHEALESHTSPHIPQNGVIRDPESEPKSREMNSDDFRNFNNQDALKSLVSPSEPFRGLITVEDWRTQDAGVYSYNPETEQLHRH